MNAMRLEKRPDGVAVLIFDTPGSPVNVLSSALFDEIGGLLDTIARDAEIKAVVLASGKRDSFIAGADLEMVVGITSADEAASLCRGAHALLDRIADNPKPFVAAIHGAALGGGLEVALACHYRVASDSPKTGLALPEVQLGLLPGAGGTQRLPRLIGLERALPMLLQGTKLRAKKALKQGLVDALTAPSGLVETAARAALQLAEGKLSRRDKRTTREAVLEFGPVRRLVISKAREQVMAKTRGLYPAPLAILDCVETGLEKGFKAGAEREAKLFGELAAGPVSKNLIFIFNAMTALKKMPPEPAPRKVRKLGVLGAGTMGEGIASVSLPNSAVVIKDVSDASLGKAAKSIHQSFVKRVKSGSLTNVERDAQWSRFFVTKDYRELAGSELIIEAVFEDLALKRQVLADCEAVLDHEAVFATNTSAIPIADIAEGAKHPERVLGMHYFSPVPKMPLLEIIVHKGTSPQALATAKAYGIAQGKTVIVVQDGPGFYTTRVLAPFMGEALALLDEGADAIALDRALKDFGFPVGPVTLMDEVGLDVGSHVGEELSAAFGHRGMRASEGLKRMVAAGFKGRKNSKGFYRYDKDAKGAKEIDPASYQFFGGTERKPIVAAEVAERMTLLLVNEAVHCLGEGIIANPRDGDIGAIMGIGFPPFRGGPFHYLDTMGLDVAVAKLRELAEKHGGRFAPAPLLVQMASEGKRFYPEANVPHVQPAAAS